MNKSPRANVFPAEKANFGHAVSRSLERYSAQASFAWPRVDLARPLRRDDFRPSWIHYPSSLSKSAGFVSSAGKVSLVSISYAKSYFYTILACLFTVEV